MGLPRPASPRRVFEEYLNGRLGLPLEADGYLIFRVSRAICLT